MRRRLHPAGAVHASAAVALLLVVAILAFKAGADSPPAIAEFAPQAQQIRAAPPEQTSRNGSAFGAPTPLPPSPLPAQASPPASGAQIRLCVGDPPRQIEDPQSPPCVPYWTGTSNGGSTSKGVSGSAIKIAIDTTEDSGRGNAAAVDTTGDLFRFFNKRFELYGRQIQIDDYTASNPCYSGDPYTQAGATNPNCGGTAAMEADARQIDVHGDFADLGYSLGGNSDGSEYYFYDLLARDHILSIQFPSHEGATYMPESHFDQYAPYEWNYLPSFDHDMAALGRFICAQLAGRAPAFAGSPQRSQSERAFGLLVQNYPNLQGPDVSPLTTETAACGAPLTVVHYDPGTGTQVNAILQLSSAGVTTVACVCQVNTYTQDFMQSASSQNYHPEWLVTNYGTQDDEYEIGYSAPKDQAAHIFGLLGFNKWLPGDERPVTWAVNDVDPGKCPTNCFNWELWAPYWELLTLVSGIQMAGPNLTPASFQAGLYRSAFPNPSCDAAPYYQACVGFGPHDHTMVQDFGLVWWDVTGDQAWKSPLSPSGGKAGGYCYVGRGLRYDATFPKVTAPFFDASQPCR